MGEKRKLPVWRTVLDCTRLVLRHWLRLTLTGLPIVLLGLFIWLPGDAVIGGPIMIDSGEPTPFGPVFPTGYILAMLGWWVLIAVTSTAALVPVHRLVLLDDRGPYRFLPYRIGLREVRFLLVLLAVWAPYTLYSEATDLTLTSVIIAAVFLTVEGAQASMSGAIAILFALIAGGVAVAWLTARLAPALPMAATDAGLALPGAWKLTRGNGWRVFAVLVIVSLPAVSLVIGLDALDILFSVWETQKPSSPEGQTTLYPEGQIIIYDVRPGWWPGIYAVGSGIVLWYGMLFEAVALSLVCRALGGCSGTEPGFTAVPAAGEA